ncbi:hypothetical protein [Paenibacillus sp. N3.4]|uniref:hypothetical protein n=1 Tax=Paenibacillus sp. N3.4 TaxID=2603222 RepID=UPI0011C95E4E|nr:hypothetical protein [Paenibacillus sp. N3.4]TXK75425.1 hypothetical protein FU659_27450 [Paenibacillus sp. N3.4]
MRTINTRQDVEDLRRDGTAPTALTKHISEFFQQLEAELADEEEDTFRLDQHGPIVLLEAGDNLYDLECVGLSRENCGLLGSMPEYVETLQLDNMTVYKIVVMYTNDFIMTFFTQQGIHDKEIEQWLIEQANNY